MPSDNNTKYVATIVVLGVLFIASAAFGVWAFSGRQDYKNNSDKKVASAVTAATTDAKNAQKAQDDAAAQLPYKTYAGSSTYGSVTFNYPKTWSALVDTTSSDEPINGYFYPDVLPALQSSSDSGSPMPFALRVELVSDDYSTVVSNFDSSVQSGDLTATAYVPPKMANVPNVQPGLRLDGAITQDFNGSMVIITIRDKTLEISTESNDFLSDFNNIVLPSLTFVP